MAFQQNVNLAKVAALFDAGKKATIYDLARLTNVSPGTVSRVLNGHHCVKAETRENVLRGAAQLNLKPQASVRNRQVVILSELSSSVCFGSYTGTFIAHLSHAFSHRNIGVMLPRYPFAELQTKFLDGAITVNCGRTMDKLVEKLGARMPVVHIDKFPLNPTEYIVCPDHFSAGYTAARHLLERGKQRPAFLGSNNYPFVERLNGFKRALLEANSPIDERRISLFGTESNRVSAITRIVRAEADSIYAPGSNFEALECMHLLSYVMGRNVPREISLIGGEIESISSLLNPPLTTIEEPLNEMAAQVVSMIDALTAGRAVSPRNIVLPIKLIDRASVQ